MVGEMASTRIAVKPDTFRYLRRRKKERGLATFDDVITDILEEIEYSSPEFRKEMNRRMREKTIPWEEVRRRLKL